MRRRAVPPSIGTLKDLAAEIGLTHEAFYRATGEIGPDLFRHACLMGLEGLVSKHHDSLYHAGRFRHWLKVKNRRHPAYRRVQDQFG